MIRYSRSFVIAAGTALSVVCAVPTFAAPVSVLWTSTNVTATADSHYGDLGIFTSLSSKPNVPTTVQDLNPASAAVPPVDTTNSQVLVNNGLPNQRSASGQVTVTGSPSASMSIYNGGGSLAGDRSDVTIHGAQFNGSSSFAGQFVSNGTNLTLDYSGLYDLYAFGANGAASSPQRAFAQVVIGLLVQDTTTSSDLYNMILLSDSREQAVCGSPCLPFRVDGGSFGNTVAIDLSGTTGDAIAVTLVTTVVTKSYAGHYSFDGSGQDTRGVASATIRDSTFAFTTDEALAAVPLPAALPLFGSGLGLIGVAGWFRRRKSAAAA